MSKPSTDKLPTDTDLTEAAKQSMTKQASVAVLQNNNSQAQMHSDPSRGVLSQDMEQKKPALPDKVTGKP